MAVSQEQNPPQPRQRLVRRGGEYLLFIQQGQVRTLMRIRSRLALSVDAYDVRADDLSTEINFYPHRAALFKLSPDRGTMDIIQGAVIITPPTAEWRYQRVIEDLYNPDSTLEMDPPTELIN